MNERNDSIMDKHKSLYYQDHIQKYVRDKYEKSIWIQVSGSEKVFDGEVNYWCGFVRKDKEASCLKDYSWDVSSQSGFPGFVIYGGNTIYSSNLLEDGFEPLLFYREFYGAAPEYVEVSQEFILLHNLRFNKKQQAYYAMKESGDTEEVIRFKDPRTIEINKTYIRRYAAAKQMSFLYYFDTRTRLPGTLRDYDIEEFSKVVKEDDIFYSICGGESNYPTYVFSRMLGKKIIRPEPIEECGFWPFEKQKTYEDFIIGTDKNGDPVKHTCNPEKLNNFFGKNEMEPAYLTPVFFKRDVLQKYYSESELYRVTDGYLSCGSLWGMAIDNHHKDVVAAYLGDLGRDLPESHQRHWVNYNIASDEALSSVTFKRDMLGIFADSDIIEHKFKRDYNKLDEIWEDSFGWQLYLPPSSEDEYILDQIRRPLNTSQHEFDQLVLLLGKVLVDFLNEKAIADRINTTQDLKGIGKLECWLNDNDHEDAKEHIEFLRNLWRLRSAGSGHRKGKGYNDLIQKFNADEFELPDVFDLILHKADEYLVYMMNLCQ